MYIPRRVIPAWVMTALRRQLIQTGCCPVCERRERHPDELPLTHAGDPLTSKLAAQNSKVRHGTQRHAVMTALNKSRGMTVDEADRVVGLGYNTRRRISELNNIGLVAWTGQTRPGDLGCLQNVWQLTPLGRARLD